MSVTTRCNTNTIELNDHVFGTEYSFTDRIPRCLLNRIIICIDTPIETDSVQTDPLYILKSFSVSAKHSIKDKILQETDEHIENFINKSSNKPYEVIDAIDKNGVKVKRVHLEPNLWINTNPLTLMALQYVESVVFKFTLEDVNKTNGKVKLFILTLDANEGSGRRFYATSSHKILMSVYVPAIITKIEDSSNTKIIEINSKTFTRSIFFYILDKKTKKPADYIFNVSLSEHYKGHCPIFDNDACYLQNTTYKSNNLTPVKDCYFYSFVSPENVNTVFDGESCPYIVNDKKNTPIIKNLFLTLTGDFSEDVSKDTEVVFYIEVEKTLDISGGLIKFAEFLI